MNKNIKNLYVIAIALIFLAIVLWAPKYLEILLNPRSWVALIVLGLVLLSPLLIFSMFKGRDGGGGENPFVDDEARQMQELYQKMESLLDRVESLETILMDRTKPNHKERKDEI